MKLLGTIKTMLNEALGYSETADLWAKLIVEQIIDYMFELKGEHTIQFKNLVQKLDKQYTEFLPINSLVLNLDIKEITSEEGGADAYFTPTNAVIENNMLNNVDLTIEIEMPEEATIENTKERLTDYLEDILTHEFLHIYEWYKRELVDPSERKDCGFIYSSGDINGNVAERIAFLIYVTQSYEMNAFVHQAISILKKKKITNSQNFLEELRNLPLIGQIIKGLSEFDSEKSLNEIEELNEEELMFLDEVKDCYYYKKDKEKIINDVKNSIFVTNLKNRFKENYQKFIKKLHKSYSLVVKEENDIDLSPRIENFLNKTIVESNKDILCGVKVIHPKKRHVERGFNEYEYYLIEFYFDKPHPHYGDVYVNIMNEAWDLVYGFINIPTDLQRKTISSCDEFKQMKLNEQSEPVMKLLYETDLNLKLKRRYNYIDDYIKRRLDKISSVFTNEKFCVQYKTAHDFLDYLAWDVLEMMYVNFFPDVDDTSEEWEDLAIQIENYVEGMHGADIQLYYHNRCKRY